MCDLRGYVGRPEPGIKVGTYNRAKGLEFKWVLLPSLGSSAIGTEDTDLDELILRGSRLYVAMTRARDELTMSFAGILSPLLDSVLPAVEIV